MQSDCSEDFLCRDQEVPRLLTPPGNIEQADEDAFGIDAYRIVEISGDPFAHEYRSDIGARDCGEDSRNWFYGQSNLGGAGAKSRKHGGKIKA